MGRAPCCDKAKVKRGPWSPEEDNTLKNYLHKHGTGGNWIALPNKAGLKRCGKSCRLRWLNYLRPDIKHGGFTEEEDNLILAMYNTIGSRWSIIASRLPGRTDNDVKNHWNTKLKKKLLSTAAATTTHDHDQINGLIKNSTSTSTMSMAQITHFDDQDHGQLASSSASASFYPNLSSFSSYLADNVVMSSNSFDPPLPQYYQPQTLPGLMEFTTDHFVNIGSNNSYNTMSSSLSHEANSSLSTNSTSWFSNGDHLQEFSNNISNLLPNGFAFQETTHDHHELAQFSDNKFLNI